MVYVNERTETVGWGLPHRVDAMAGTPTRPKMPRLPVLDTKCTTGGYAALTAPTMRKRPSPVG